MRKVFKKKKPNSKLDNFIKKYNISREFLSINRKSISRGLLVGIFWGLVPMPFQMVAVVAMTPFFKFNTPIALATVWLSNPITMPFMYFIEYKTGVFLLGLETLNVELTLEWFQNNLSQIFIPLYVGTLFYCLTLAPLTYFIINWLWVHSVRKERRHQKRKDNKAKRVK